jgi:hypothetical protein
LESFNDINIPIYTGGLEITFTRNYNNNVVYHWKSLKPDGSEDASSLPYEGSVEIKAFYFRVPIIEYNNEAKINLIGELFKRNYIFQFKKWQCIRHTDVIGNTLNIDITNIILFGYLLFSKQVDLIVNRKIMAYLIM